MRDIKLYKNHARYERAVADINKILELSSAGRNISLTLANYTDSDLLPSQSSDLILAARKHKDNIFYPYFSKRISELLAGDTDALVGFSLTYLSQAICTFAMIGFIKKHYPNRRVVIGGGLVTSWVNNPAWKNPFSEIIDHIIPGPGEKPLVKLLSQQKKVKLGLPGYTGLPIDQYLSPGFILPYAASSGCYWRKCNFCPEKAEGNPYQKIKPEQVIKEISELRTQTNPILVHFLDNAMSPDLLKTIVKTPFNTPWYGFVRISPLLTDVKFCKNLKNSGCLMLKIGLESGSQTVLDSMEKGIHLHVASKALKTLESVGISTYVYLLFGTPAESIKEARETLTYVKNHCWAITYLNLAIFNMPTCTRETNLVATRDFYEGDLSLYTDFVHEKDWGRKQVRQFLNDEFKCHPAVKKILQRTPSFFTSNHAPFFKIPAK
jgi:radical SAM superfamily enzyme YgiQ (UPF0313 family)